jgi:hypothetical protein
VNATARRNLKLRIIIFSGRQSPPTGMSVSSHSSSRRFRTSGARICVNLRLEQHLAIVDDADFDHGVHDI